METIPEKLTGRKWGRVGESGGGWGGMLEVGLKRYGNSHIASIHAGFAACWGGPKNDTASAAHD